MRTVKVELSEQTVTMRVPKATEWKEYRQAIACVSKLADIDSDEADDALTDPKVVKLLSSLTGLEEEVVTDLYLDDYLVLVNALERVSPDFQKSKTP